MLLWLFRTGKCHMKNLHQSRNILNRAEQLVMEICFKKTRMNCRKYFTLLLDFIYFTSIYPLELLLWIFEFSKKAETMKIFYLVYPTLKKNNGTGFIILRRYTMRRAYFYCFFVCFVVFLFVYLCLPAWLSAPSVRLFVCLCMSVYLPVSTIT